MLFPRADAIKSNMEKNRTTGAIIVGISCIVVAIQVAFISGYTSTDFEVHRNWMAVVHHLPLQKWYFEKTSEWTLDYPPFFAYFEKLLAIAAARLLPDEALELRKEPIMNNTILRFQRFTVILTHLIFIYACYRFCFNDTGRWRKMPKGLRKRSQIALFVLLVSNIGFFIVDGIHFQYNGLLTSLLIFSMILMDQGSFLKGALIFCVLLNFKHIYLYYAPAFVAFYLVCYFEVKFKFDPMLIVKRGINLFGVMLVPFLLSFTPFLWMTGLDGVKQILSRLFPVQRGLTHAYWAPNFWALYNIADISSYRLLTLAGFKFNPPTYTSGLVQEYAHSVLPTIGTKETLICTLISLLPLIAIMKKSKTTDFAIYLTLSSFSFFLFGYHVHEKAIIMVTIPLSIAAFTNSAHLSSWIILNTISITSLFPLLFTLFEIPTKYSIGLAYFFASLLCVRYVFMIKIRHILSKKLCCYIAGLFCIEIYNTMLHKVLFGERLTFLPLLLISVYNSFGIFYAYLLILWTELADTYVVGISKWCLKRQEHQALQNPPKTLSSLKDVHIVAGADISTCKAFPDLGVVTLSLFSYPEFSEIASFDCVRVISAPYISDYLGLREVKPLSELINEVVSRFPTLRPDVLFIDGNGKFHARGCGLACLVASKTGIPAVGIAKNFNISCLIADGFSKDGINEAEKIVDEIINLPGSSNGFYQFDMVRPNTLNIVRTGGSKQPVFVSSGGGISLDDATQLVLQSSSNRISIPIRMADLRSREIIRKTFEE